jgi:hypothetical protein
MILLLCVGVVAAGSMEMRALSTGLTQKLTKLQAE